MTNVKQILSGLALSGLAFGCLLGYMAWKLWQSEQDFRTWPSVQGRVITSSIDREYKYAVSGSANGARSEYWVFQVSYSYEVNGHVYTGTRHSNHPILESTAFNNQPSAELHSAAEKFHSGAVIPVYYAPRKPQSSYLQIDFGGARLFSIWAGICIAVAIVCFSAFLII